MAPRRSPSTQSGLVVEHRPAGEGTPPLEIRASTRRKKTATAWWQGPTLIVAVPARVRGKEREDLIAWLVERSHRRRPSMVTSDPDLLERARLLVRRYDLGVDPVSVRFVGTQQRRWGSCTPETGAIRISDRLVPVPGWVLDAVLVHELAHLRHADHGPEFSALADRHPRRVEASIFLEGYQLGREMLEAPAVPAEPHADLDDAGSSAPSTTLF